MSGNLDKITRVDRAVGRTIEPFLGPAGGLTRLSQGYQGIKVCQGIKAS